MHLILHVGYSWFGIKVFAHLQQNVDLGGGLVEALLDRHGHAVQQLYQLQLLLKGKQAVL